MQTPVTPSLHRNFLNVGALTLVSRLFGFVRDILMAVLLGAGPVADAFFAAFRFPNLFRRLFAEGAFNTAFVPLFAGALEQEGDGAARALASRILSWLVAVLCIVTILAEVFMEQVLVPFVPGFLDDPDKFALTVLLTRICFPYLVLMSLMAAYAAILNALGRYVAAAAAPVLLNVVMIGVLIPLIYFAAGEPEQAAFYLSFGALAGGAAQVGLVYLAVQRAEFVPHLGWPRLDRQVRRFWILAVPAVLAGGIVQINIFIGTVIASQADSAISYLYYADRLYQLPLGIIGIAIGTVLLPELSRHLKGRREQAAATAQDQSIHVAILLSAPAAAGLVGLALPIMVVLFERGAFTHEASLASASALTGFGFGLPAFVLVRVLQPGFFAREDMVRPTVFAGLSLMVNVVLSVVLFGAYQHVGIAVATSISAWVNVGLLGGVLMRRGHLRITPVQIRRAVVITLLSVGLGLVLYWASSAMPIMNGAPGSLAARVAILGVIVAGGLVAYFMCLHVTGVQRFDLLVRQLRRPLAGRTGSGQ